MTVAAALLAVGCSVPQPRPFSNKVCLELYQVQDLVCCFGEVCRMQGDSPGRKLPDGVIGCYEFAEGIKAAIAPKQWDKEDGWSVVGQNGLMIVRAPEYIHKAVESYLWTERQMAGEAQQEGRKP